jgi:uncharacterized membrane protein
MSSVRLRNFWDSVRATYWFVPAVMTLLAAVLALTMFGVDQGIPNYLLQDKWYIFHPETIVEARTLLNTIADTSLGVVGVVFSITLVPLSITSTQYGSIVLRGFLRDRGTQFVLGAYTATTFYCLSLLLGLAGAGDQTVQLSVTIAFYMLSASLLLLIYFFHHVADSLQASSVVEQVSRELEQVIEQDYPLEETAAPIDDQHAEEVIRQTAASEGEVITSNREGYVRAIDYGQLINIASKHRLILRIECLPGDFVSISDPLMIAWPSPLDEHTRSLANRAYMLGKNRTLFQDTEFGIYLIVTIAVRALSPAINDPNTPVLCLNRLGAALGVLAERQKHSPYFFDKDNQLRLISDPVSFERLVGVAFDMIREYGRANAEVLIQMLETIKSVTAHTHSDTQRKVLLKHATLIEHDSHIGLPSEYDKQRVHDSYDETVRAIGLGYEPKNFPNR